MQAYIQTKRDKKITCNIIGFEDFGYYVYDKERDYIAQAYINALFLFIEILFSGTDIALLHKSLEKINLLNNSADIKQRATYLSFSSVIGKTIVLPFI